MRWKRCAVRAWSAHTAARGRVTQLPLRGDSTKRCACEQPSGCEGRWRSACGVAIVSGRSGGDRDGGPTGPRYDARALGCSVRAAVLTGAAPGCRRGECDFVAARPTSRSRCALCWLEAFQPGRAELVVSWVQSRQESFWLAPRTPPPLTATEIVGWQGPGRSAHTLFTPDYPVPVGYGELNVLNGAARTYWLGHLIVAPAQRDRGYGLQLTRLLLRQAFSRHGAREVSLVVFPENRAAIRCYRAAGLRDDGCERHEFPAYGVQVELLRMVTRGGAYYI